MSNFLLYLLRWLLIIVLSIVMIIIITFASYSQVTFTESELITLAEHNLERKHCLEINTILENQIDTLDAKISYLDQSLALKDSMIVNYQNLIANFNSIEKIRIDQVEQLKISNSQKDQTIKNRNNRLTFWRIFTPITITATAILGLLY